MIFGISYANWQVIGVLLSTILAVLALLYSVWQNNKIKTKILKCLKNHLEVFLEFIQLL